MIYFWSYWGTSYGLTLWLAFNLAVVAWLTLRESLRESLRSLRSLRLARKNEGKPGRLNKG